VYNALKNKAMQKEFLTNLEKTKELVLGLCNMDAVLKLFKDDEGVSYIYHKDNPTLLGSQFLLKVNTSVGISEPCDLKEELRKIEVISSVHYAPDLIMDHTRNIALNKSLWKHLIEMVNVPIGTVPVYSVFDETKGIDKLFLLDIIQEMAEGGVNLMTFHPTVTRELYDLAKKTRGIPISSWGGGVVLQDMIINNREHNIIVEMFADILAILKKHNVTISIGSVFRPAGIIDALDSVHLLETEEQKKYIDIAKANKVNVIMEGIGHIGIDLIPKYCDTIRPYKTPLMPLGPIPTDASIGYDHVSGILGAYEVVKQGVVGIINSVTRAEHLGNVPTTEEVLEGLMNARTLAHVINLTRFEHFRQLDTNIYKNRAIGRTCMVNGGLFNISPNPENRQGCNRCGVQCPLSLL